MVFLGGDLQERERRYERERERLEYRVANLDFLRAFEKNLKVKFETSRRKRVVISMATNNSGINFVEKMARLYKELSTPQ